MNKLEIENFFSIIKTKINLVKQVRHSYGKDIAPDFNSFDFWWIDENKVSQIIAFFLTPNETHEQGDIYLKHFIKKFNLDFFNFNNNDKIDVKCELKTDSGRRIDIVIAKNNFEEVIAIENKIHIETADQKNQVLDYIKYLQNNVKNRFCLIYLSPKEKTVSEISITEELKEKLKKENKLRFLNYEDNIIECINEFGLLTENYRVKSFLKDFENKLKSMYMGQENMNIQQIVADFIIEKGENIETSFAVANALEDVKNRLKEKFEQQIQEIGNELGIEVQGLKLKPRNWNKHRITFSYESGGLLYGITRLQEDKNKTRFLEIEDLLFEKIDEKFNVSSWWPMWQFFYRNISVNEQFWLDIENGEAQKRAKLFIDLINENFDTSEY